MSKSVLVIDTPESCCSCHLCGFTLNSHYCRGKLKDIKDTNTKPDWCPLRPLPEKKEYINSNSNIEATKNIAAAGWNDCIDEITGGSSDD